MIEAITESKATEGSDMNISVDGIWQKRGFSSLNGVVAAVSVTTGKVVDVEVMSRNCKGCVSHDYSKTTSPADYDTWKTTSPVGYDTWKTTSPVGYDTWKTTSPVGYDTWKTTSPVGYDTWKTTSPVEYDTWKSSHDKKCQLNYVGSAPNMETTGAKNIFARCYQLRCPLYRLLWRW